MKTKLFFILAVLITVSMQAQIPTLVDKKLSRDYIFAKKIIRIDNPTAKKEKDSLKVEKKILEDSIQKNQRDLTAEERSKVETETKKLNEQIKNIDERINAIASIEEPYYVKEFSRVYNRKIKEKSDEIESIKVKMKDMNDIDEVDEALETIRKLNHEITELQYELKMRRSDDRLLFLPSSSKKFGTVFFKKMYYTDGTHTSYLNSLALNYSSSGTVAQSEVLADTFGPVRMSLGTVIQSNSETPETEVEKEEQQEEDQLETLMNGGGNFYLETILPAFIYSNDKFSGYFYANNRTGLGLKGLSDSVDTSTFNSAFGTNLYLGYNSNEKKFNVFFNADASYNFASKAVYENLNMKDRKPFLTGKLIAGLTFSNKFRLSATFLTFGSDESLRSGKVVVGLQIIPQKN